jgi:hypothetical protein
MPNSATSYWGAIFLGTLCVLTGACGRGAVDSDSSRPTATVAAGGSEGALAAPNAWSIAELYRHRDLPADQRVSVQGFLKEVSMCGGCPEGAACAPCASWFSLGAQLDSGADGTVGFTNTRSAMSQDFHVGQRYVFSGTLREWRDPSAGHPTFVNFDYVSHRALE